MIKLIILIEPPRNPEFFENEWPRFMHLSAQLPGLRYETNGEVMTKVFGRQSFKTIHELYFDSMNDIQMALRSPIGQKAGQVLQAITENRVTLLIADHTGDDVTNFNSLAPQS